MLGGMKMSSIENIKNKLIQIHSSIAADKPHRMYWSWIEVKVLLEKIIDWIDEEGAPDDL